ncbi:MAG: cytochrome c family protein [Parvibaculaceae bacterium]|nr:cytochrome c family protein [Parvibaculaceae bacterium]
MKFVWKGIVAPALALTIGLGMAISTPVMADPIVPNLKKGAKVFKKCKACHTLKEGEANKIGPNLYGVFTRGVATVEGFNYSKAMRAKAPEIAEWNDETLAAYLTKPSKYVKGTAMSFAGLRKEKQRVNIIAYLKQETGAPTTDAAPQAE